MTTSPIDLKPVKLTRGMEDLLFGFVTEFASIQIPTIIIMNANNIMPWKLSTQISHLPLIGRPCEPP